VIQLRIKESGTLIGQISEEELQFLIDNLEEEWEEDRDYYLNQTMLNALKAKPDAPQRLLEMLDKAAGGGDIEVEWSRK
jgi:hypothetical protein